ncbi:MAG TPA: ATP-binding protein [Deltaproteobacteria bacterium]|nr:ATP-binding protein [Deltaproteobacteria bacterium]
MAVVVRSGVMQGVDAIPIEVEVDLLRRLPSVCIVGLPASAVRESAERIRSAIEGADEPFPRRRVVVNLAPADVKKEGTVLDLPMALGILAAAERVPVEAVSSVLAVGELSLGGVLRPIRGALSLALLARRLGLSLLLPRASASVAALVPEVEIVGASTLSEALAWLRGERVLPRAEPAPICEEHTTRDLSEVRGQQVPRWALEIAAAGAHHLLLIGPPGCGKSMLAARLPSILPPLTFEEALATTRIHSAAGLLDDARVLRSRPFRAPHHSVTVAGLVGDRRLRPGEISLAHNGVLFLDEAPEFRRAGIEVLRQPLEEGRIQLSRAQGTIEYPAAITLVMAANPCPCGMRGAGCCGCTDADVARYLRRLSGPILDRVDLHVQVQPIDSRELLGGPRGEDSATVRARVIAARERQQARGQRVPNGRLPPSEVARVAALRADAQEILASSAHRHGLSGRATTRIIKVARTLADLDGDGGVSERHVARALAFRPSLDLWG